ncbi:MAG: ABC transporter ATP-binding protein [Rhodospirillales bacterium]
MSEIRIEGLRHSYARNPTAGDLWALKQVDHVWQDGGAYALLGPSGCGKTTMLNIISGLVRPSEGRILFGARDVTAVPTERRNIAQVFQFPVLYDTMTVRGNLAFPLRNRGVGKAERQARVEEVAAMLGLSDSLDLRAAGLGAAEKQMISLGRGLVRSNVAAILFDEPLTVIDPQVKFTLRRKLKEVHERFKPTLIYVTHDQNEALTFADQVVVMYDGEVVQVGTPEDLYERPAHSFVGYFIGSPGMNFLPVEPSGGRLVFPGGALALDETVAAGLAGKGALKLGIRPSAVRICDLKVPGAIPADVVDVEALGAYAIVELALGPTRIKARVRDGEPIPGGATAVTLPPHQTLLYADERLIGALA